MRIFWERKGKEGKRGWEEPCNLHKLCISSEMRERERERERERKREREKCQSFQINLNFGSTKKKKKKVRVCRIEATEDSFTVSIRLMKLFI